jgi:hypothetical protein
VKVLHAIEQLMENIPFHRRVILLEQALKDARQDAKGAEAMWRKLAREDVDTDIQV